MQWTYDGKQIDEIPEEYEGFVYLITNTLTGPKYIGKKLAKFKTFRRQRQEKQKTRNKRT